MGEGGGILGRSTVPLSFETLKGRLSEIIQKHYPDPCKLFRSKCYLGQNAI